MFNSGFSNENLVVLYSTSHVNYYNTTPAYHVGLVSVITGSGGTWNWIPYCHSQIPLHGSIPGSQVGQGLFAAHHTLHADVCPQRPLLPWSALHDEKHLPGQQGNEESNILCSRFESHVPEVQLIILWVVLCCVVLLCSSSKCLNFILGARKAPKVSFTVSISRVCFGLSLISWCNCDVIGSLQQGKQCKVPSEGALCGLWWGCRVQTPLVGPVWVPLSAAGIVPQWQLHVRV